MYVLGKKKGMTDFFIHLLWVFGEGKRFSCSSMQIHLRTYEPYSLISNKHTYVGLIYIAIVCGGMKNCLLGENHSRRFMFIKSGKQICQFSLNDSNDMISS